MRSALPLIIVLPVWLLMLGGAEELFAPNRDSPWHLAAGELMLEQGKIPQTDPFSFTASDHPWVNPAWLYDALIAGVTSLSGLGGAILFTTALTALLVWLLSRHLLAREFEPLVILFLLVPILSFISPNLTLRPQLTTLLLSFIFYLTLHRSRERPKYLLFLPILALLWANLHGGVLLGIAIIGAFGLEAVVQRNAKRVGALFATGLICLALTLATPYGIETYRMMERIYHGITITRISEWRSPLHMPRYWYFLALYPVFALLYRKQAGGVTLADRFIFFGLLLASLSSRRHVPIFMLLAAPAMVGMASQILRNQSQRNLGKTLLKISRDWGEKLRQERIVNLANNGAVFVVVASLLFVALQPDWEKKLLPADRFPTAEIDYLMEHYPGCRLYAQYAYGGLIIYLGKSKLPLFFDGRAENAYPQNILRDGLRIDEQDEGWEKLMDDYAIETVLMPGQASLTTKLLADKRWEEAFAGPADKVLVRKSADCLQRKH